MRGLDTERVADIFYRRALIIQRRRKFVYRGQLDSAKSVDGICRKFAMKHEATHGFCTAKLDGLKIFCAARSIGCRCPVRHAQIS
jgi:hypothetical protein